MKWFTVIFTLMFLANPVWALTPEERGLELAKEMDRRDNGFGDFVAEMEMILRNKQGEESKRRIRSKTLEVANDGDKTLVSFDDPADVKGTVFLSYTHATKADEQWLFLPALKRVKRIASQNKSGPFMGSEFAYEDITSQEVDKYTYKFLREEASDDRQAFVIERYPAYENSGYTRQVVWLDKERYQPLKIEFYDRKGALLKTTTFTAYQQYLNQYWRASNMHVVNHLTGKSTQLIWSNYRFKTGLNPRDFDQNSLLRAE